MEGESDVTRSIFDVLHFWDIQRDQMEVKVALVEVSLMNFIFRRPKEIQRKVKVVLLEVSLMNFILGMSKEVKWKVKVVLLEV